MIYDYDSQQNDHDNLQVVAEPDADNEYGNAKNYLQTASTDTGDNLYDHLTEVLNKILAERPENVIDFFEEYSRKVKEKRFRPLTDHLEDIFVPAGRYHLAKTFIPMFKPLPPKELSTVDPEDLELADMSRNNMLDMLHHLEQIGIGLPRHEMFFVMLSMRRLIHTEPIATIRFWGKIMGTLKNYYVIETELKEEEYMKRNETFQDEREQQTGEQIPIVDENTMNNPQDMEKALEDIEKDQVLGEGPFTKIPRPLPPEPKILYEEPLEPPPEPSGVGVNKKVYYVCTDIGDTWIQLPDLTPKHVRIARQIYKSFTGYLDHPIETYPEFPGTEKEYLRAQIARISSGTQIAPLGFYTFGGDVGGEGDEEDEEEAEDEEAAGDVNKTQYKINPKYDPPPLKDLLDRSMSFWVHTGHYILPQGRTSWWNPYPPPDVEDEEAGGGEEEEEEEEAGDKVKVGRAEPETGPPLLTPCSEDASLETMPPWTVRSSSNIFEEYALVEVRSNLWPGAYTFTTQGKIFHNIYFGYGLKHLEQNFSPSPLHAVQQEYPVGPEIMEITDPTGAEEEQWRIDHLPKPIAILPGEEAEPEQPEEEEEDEDEDDDE